VLADVTRYQCAVLTREMPSGRVDVEDVVVFVIGVMERVTPHCLTDLAYIGSTWVAECEMPLGILDDVATTDDVRQQSQDVEEPCEGVDLMEVHSAVSAADVMLVVVGNCVHHLVLVLVLAPVPVVAAATAVAERPID
jgi:hypothetical protein